MAATASTEPGWAETSVRWLRTNHPEYVPSVSKRPAATLLVRALKLMKYNRHAMATFSQEAWDNYLTSSVTDWRSGSHARMVEFLKEGRHEAAVEKTKRETAVREKSMTKAASEAVKVMVPGGVAEEFDIEMDDLDEIEEALVKDHAPRSQLSPKHELDEIVASAALISDPRYGVW